MPMLGKSKSGDNMEGIVISLSYTRAKGGTATHTTLSLEECEKEHSFSPSEIYRLTNGQNVVRHINAGFYTEVQKFSMKREGV